MHTKDERIVNKPKTYTRHQKFECKEETVRFRVTSKEKEIFDNYCKEHGMKFSELARKSIFEYIESHR